MSTLCSDAGPASEKLDEKNAVQIPEKEHNGDVAKADLAESKETSKEGGSAHDVFTFQLKVILPHEPHTVDVVVSSAEQFQEIRSVVTEFPGTFQYSCFHFEHNEKPVNDYIEVFEIPGLIANPVVTLVEDPYTEKDARGHILRVRDLLGVGGDRTDTISGILSGTALHDSIVPRSLITTMNPETSSAPPKPPKGHEAFNFDFDFNQPGSVNTLLPPNKDPAPKAIKSIALSAWNPPPYHLRQRGHLLYLQIVTNEGEQHHITSHISGFFVNKSTNSKFDPFPRSSPKNFAAHSLITLFGMISPSFPSAFLALQDYNNQSEPLALYQFANSIAASPWMVPSSTSPLCAHQPDLLRSQETLLLAGSDNIDNLRDWNEEFQATRELPRETLQERVLRQRLLFKLYAEFNDAAARAAVTIARGEVLPLNPGEEPDARIFVMNNVFFSSGVDGVGTFVAEGGDEAARAATGKDVQGVKAINQLDISDLFTPGTIVVDYLGKRIVGQSIIPGIFRQRDPGESQIEYGGVEGKDIVAANQAFVPVFQKVSQAVRSKPHAVWDKEGKRHDLEGSIETKGLMGLDGRKYILDLYRITPLDVSWLENHWTDPEPKVEGTDAAASMGYPHRLASLRLELVEAFWKFKMREWVTAEVEKKRKARKEVDGTNGMTQKSSTEESSAKSEPKANEESSIEQERIDISDFKFSLNTDILTGQKPNTDEEREEWAADEKDVRAACEFLTSKVIPELIRDLKEGDVGYPMDGTSLTRLLHKRGINIRYLGNIVKLAEGPRLLPLKVIALHELLSRAFKHVANGYLKTLPIPFAHACLAHLLNCLLGVKLNPAPTPEIDESLRGLYPKVELKYTTVTPGSLKDEIESQIRRRYRIEWEPEWTAEMKHMQLLREISLKLGLQLEAKEYQFDEIHSPVPATQITKALEGNLNGKSKKKKKNGDVTHTPSSEFSDSSQGVVTFMADNILHVVPVVKNSIPKSILAEETLEAGRMSIQEGHKELGQELLLESLSLHEQIYGIIHPDVARAYAALSTVYYQLDEKLAAVELSRKAVIIAERTLGVDSAETILNYLNLGLFEHANNNSSAALLYIKHALGLLKMTYGCNHPDSITTINNAAVMLQQLKYFHESRIWYEASLVICEKIFGRQSVNAATILFQLAQALALDKEPKAAVNRVRESYNIFLTELGPTDRNTKEAEYWLEQLTLNAVSIAKQERGLLDRSRAKWLEITPRGSLTRSQMQLRQPSPVVPKSSESSSTSRRISLDSRSIDELLKYIEGNSDASTRKTAKKTPTTPGTNPKSRGRRRPLP
ncbi:MAG: Intracellular distribution of mitochondria [Trizodia sp. TS-e1964]|nr:MAG: Intracellular distribution of mitochondria [Trizodia sp. TS-e1964]